MQITTREAARILKCSTNSVPRLVTPNGKGRTDGKRTRTTYNTYSLDEVKKVAVGRTKHYNRNRTSEGDASRSYVKKKRGIRKQDDPYHVAVKPKTGTRKCPLCGDGPLLVGQYMCEKCRSTRPLKGVFDAALAYGSRI